jgi:hypothetical protein
LQELDSLYLIVAQATVKTDGKSEQMSFKVINMSQKDPRTQLQSLLDAKMYAAALNLAEQLMDNDCPLVSLDDYVMI